MSEVFQKGATSKSLYVTIRDSATMAGKTGLLFSTAGLKVYYTRDGAVATAITLVTQTVTGAYSSGGFVEIDATNAPGLYRLDVPDAVLATGVNAARISWTGASTLEDRTDIALVDYDPVTIDKTGFALAATGLDPVLDAANSAEAGLSVRGFLRLAASVLFGKSTSAAGTTTFRDFGDTKNRVTSTASSGARTAVTTDQT